MSKQGACIIENLRARLQALQAENDALVAERGAGSGGGVEEKAKVAVLTISESVIQEVAKKFGYEVIRSEALYGGYSSSNVRCDLRSFADGSSRTLMLKFANPDHSYDDIAHQVHVLGHLRTQKVRAGFLHEKVAKSSAAGGKADPANYIVKTEPDGFFAILMDFIEGEAGDKVLAKILKNRSEAQTGACRIMSLLGGALAQLHQVQWPEWGKSLRDVSVGFPVSNTGDLMRVGFCEDQLTSPLVHDHPFVDFLTSRIPRFRKLYEEYSNDSPTPNSSAVDAIPAATGLPSGLIHGDAFLDNTMYDSGGKHLLALVDWEDSCVGPLALDLAACAAGCCFTGTNELMTDRFAALMEGYNAQKPIASQELEVIPHFMWAATLSCGYYRFVEFNIKLPNSDPMAKESYRTMHERVERIEQLDLKGILEKLFR